MIGEKLREYAETPDRFAPIPDGISVSRVDDGRICIVQGATWASISGPRFDEHELDDVIAHVHKVVPAGKRQTWWIGPSARPANAIKLLQERGFEYAEQPEVRALVLTTPPACRCRRDRRSARRALRGLRRLTRAAVGRVRHTRRAARPATRAPEDRVRRVDRARRPGCLRCVPGGPARRDGSGHPFRAWRLPDRRRDGAVGAWPRCLPSARPCPLGLRGRTGHARARHRGARRHVVSDPAAPRLRRGMHDLAR